MSLLRQDRRSFGRAVVAILIGIVLLLTGCATVINSERQSVLIMTDPPEAEVWVDDKFHVRSHGKVRVSRLSDHHVVVEKEGYEPAVTTITRSRSKMIWLNLFCIGFWVYCFDSDKKDGGWYKFDDVILIKLKKKA